MKTKGFIFTIDAVFSLIVASAAVGILVYAHFTEPASFQVTTSEAFSAAQTLIQTRLASLSSQYAYAAANSSAAYQTWPYFANGGSLSAASSSGPLLPMLLFQFTAQKAITSPVSVDSGMAVFGAGNTIYIVNATNGNQILSKSISGNVLYPIIYRGYIIYGNSSGGITEIQDTGSVVWKSTPASAPTTPLTIGNNYLAYASGNTVVLVSPLNGSTITTLGLASQATLPAFQSGELVVSSTASAQNYLYAFSLNRAGVTQIWKRALTSSTTVSPSTSGNIIVVGSGNEIIAMTTGGNTLWTDAVPGGQVTAAGSIRGGNAYYTFGASILQINFSCGCTTQSFAIPYTTNIVPSTTPTQLYTIGGFGNFISYGISQSKIGQELWSVTLPASTNIAYQDVPLAYGNAYLTGGNTLYVFGTCSAPGSQSVLQAIGAIYLKGQGGCATQILNSTYRSSNLGIFINGTYAPSLRAAGFNGASSYVEVPDSSSIDPGSAITILAWVYISAYNTSPGALMCVTCKWGFSTGTDEYFFGINSNGQEVVALGNGVDTGGHTASYSVPTGEWQQVGLEYNGTAEFAILNGEMTLLANGLSGSTIPTSPPTLGIGANLYAPLSRFNGYMENVQIYEGALNASQIGSEYLGGIGGVPAQNTNLASIGAWYPLDGDANDYSGNANVGYPNNVVYSKRPFSPISLLNSYEVSAASFPASLGAGLSLYNVSVVIWR